MPDLLKEFHLDHSMGGILLMGAYVGFFVATLLTGIIADRMGKKVVIYIASISLLIGIIGVAFLNAFIALFCSMCFIGIALGSLELGCNYIIAETHKDSKGKYLNLLSSFHGLGSIVGPFYAGQLLARNISWQQVYVFSFPLALLLFVGFILIRYPSTRITEHQKKQSIHIKGYWSDGMPWLYFIIFTYVATELSIGSWLVEFLQSEKAQSVQLSTLMLSLFFVALTIGRLCGSFIVERVGYIRIMIGTTVMASICLAVGIFGPPILVFAIPLSGLFLSIMFPTITALATNMHNEGGGTILGILFAVAGIGGMFGPWVVGRLSDILNVQIGFGAIIFFCILTLATLVALAGMKKTTVGQPK